MRSGNERHVNLVLGLVFLASCVLAESGSDHHHGHVYELGVSLGMAHLSEDSENVPGMHLHLMRHLGEDSPLNRVALGAGIEHLFTEHAHTSLLGTLALNPFGALIIDISPGMLFAEHEGEKETRWIAHLEGTWEFDLHGFGIGPVIGAAWSGENKHTMIGIHIGRGL